MYARIARFEGGDVSQIDDVINAARQMIDSTFDSPPEGLEGSRAVWMLVDRENARGLGITFLKPKRTCAAETRCSTRCRRLWTPARAGRASRSTR